MEKLHIEITEPQKRFLRSFPHGYQSYLVRCFLDALMELRNAEGKPAVHRLVDSLSFTKKDLTHDPK